MSHEPPAHLSEVGNSAWKRIVAECAAKRIDCSEKYDALERFSVTYQLWIDCQSAISREGQVLKRGRKKTFDRNPRMVDYHQLTTGLGRIGNPYQPPATNIRG